MVRRKVVDDMVLASNEWLSNSGDEQKSSEVTPSNSEINTATAGTTRAELIDPNFMSTTRAIDNSEEELIINNTAAETEAATTTESLPLEILTEDNRNQQSLKSSLEKLQKFEEEQKSICDLLKAMATASNNSDYSNNDAGNFHSDMDTSRTAIPSTNLGQGEGELENNNQSYSAFIDATTFNDMIVSGLDSDPTDSNTNTLNNDMIVKAAATAAATTQQPSSVDSALNKVTDQSVFLNTLTIGGNIANANTVQTIAMNNANAMSSSGNKPLSSIVFSKDAARSSMTLNNGSNNVNNKNINIVNSNNDPLASTNNGQAKIVLICEQSSHPFQTRTISLTPNIECKVGRLIAKCKASESNAIFDCKVLSRNHAVLWYSDDGKFWVKDTKSSNGTFINDNKLGIEAAELHYGDIVKFGVDVLENSRKEVHGCIIACVKLYTPDGREAISIDCNSQRSQFSGDSRISFDDLHRLNVYMQETSQREKALKSKLYNIQNLLDATRKNSSTCWQAMISEDQLLHRIHSLEKKIQILEKNMPENALKNEIMKLIDDKTAYQHSAKEALRSVYLERCEAMQKLAKLETDFATSENECKILRDQITCTEESLQDVNDRLRLLEREYTDYRTETGRQQLEAKGELEQHISELSKKMQQREEECDTLRYRITELMQQNNITSGRSDSHGEDEKLQKQAIENLDAVIADMDIGDDDDDDDDDEEDEVDDDVAMALRMQQQQNVKAQDDVFEFNGSSDGSGNGKEEKFNDKENSDSKNVSGGEATIMKWLQNSDMNKKEGSLEIFKAICNNESDSSDEHEAISPAADAAVAIIGTSDEFKIRCTKLTNKLQGLKKNITKLDNSLVVNKPVMKIEKSDNVVNIDENPEKAQQEETIIDKLKKDQNSIELLTTTVHLLNDAYEEICENFTQLQSVAVTKLAHQQQSNDTTSAETLTTSSTQFQKVNNITSVGSGGNYQLPEIDEVDDERDSDDDNDNEHNNKKIKGESEVKGKGKQKSKRLSKESITAISVKNVFEPVILNYQIQLEDLEAKLHDKENDTKNTLEIMQIECDAYKDKVTELMKVNELLRQEKDRYIQQQGTTNDIATSALKLNTVVDDVSGDGVSSDSGVSSIDKTTETLIQPVADASANTTISGHISDVESVAAASAAFEQQMRDELEAINSTAVQREEELIAYKESLEKTQQENLKLRDEMLQIQKRHDSTNNIAIMRMVVPMGVAVIGVLAYLIITYL